MTSKIQFLTGAFASILSTGAFFTYHGKRNTFVNPALYGVSTKGVESELYKVNEKQSAFRPFLSTLSFLYGYCVDTGYALCAGYGRGKLHFETGLFGPLREALSVAEILQNKRETCYTKNDAKNMLNWIGKPDIEWDHEWKLNESGNWQRDGKFITPLYNIFPKYLIDKLINKESKYSYIRYIKPKKNNNNNNVKQQKKKTKQIPLCLHLPCSGDQTFEWRSNHFANPLATNDNIASVIIICPFYGQRQVPNRPVRGVQVDRVSDLFTSGICLLTESVSLLSYFKDHIPEHHDGKFIVCGISMGASIAGLLATFSPIPFNMVAVAPSHSAASLWRDGVMNKVCAWDTLQEFANDNKNGMGSILNGQSANEYVYKQLEKTDIRYFQIPFNFLPENERPKHHILIAGINDAYIPTNTVNMVAHRFKNTCSLRWTLGGHATLVVLHKQLVRDSIREVALKIMSAEEDSV